VIDAITRAYGETYATVHRGVYQRSAEMTLAFEAGIPLLLAFRRTVYWGICAGLFFHALLAIHPHPGVSSFSATLYALYFLFLPKDAVQALAAVWEANSRAWRKAPACRSKSWSA